MRIEIPIIQEIHNAEEKHKAELTGMPYEPQLDRGFYCCDHTEIAAMKTSSIARGKAAFCVLGEWYISDLTYRQLVTQVSSLDGVVVLPIKSDGK